ncbi:MAG: hypothetical protein NXI04_24900 [Planctomycetaceae bacterium]|nr:hypothetical protein [Planctomycetaceae bacterium]
MLPANTIRGDMNDPAEQSNPFQAPESAVEQPQLAHDTQFLVSEDFILSDATVNLPQVCIFTGAQTELKKLNRNTFWYPRWVQLLRFLSTFFLLMCIPVVVQMIDRAGPMWEEGVYVGCVSLAFVMSFGLGFLLRLPVSMEWYVATDVLRRRSNQRITMLSIGGVLVTLLILMGTGLAPVAAWVTLIPVVIVGLMIFRVIKRPVGPDIVVRRDGLFVIGGLKKPFLRKVHQMIDDFNRQQEAASASGT